MRTEGVLFRCAALVLLGSLVSIWLSAGPRSPALDRQRCARDVAQRPDPDARAIETQTATMPAAPADQTRRYGLVINGDASSHHVQNCLDAYQALRANGFGDKDIFLLSNEPRIGVMRVPTMGHNDGPPTFRNLAAVFKFLQQAVRPTDTLVVYVTGHGGAEVKKRPGDCFIELVPRANDVQAANRLALWIDEFIAQVNSIHPRRGLLVFDQCFGQAFATKLGRGPFAAIALSNSAEEVYCQNFSPVFWHEMRRAGQAHQRSPKNSVKAAYQRAARRARALEKTQKPMMKCAFDTAQFFLWE